MTQQYDMSNLAYRLKARLSLANFKREHGCESLDLLTLESSLKERVSKPTSSLTKLNIHDKKRKRLITSQHRRFYPLYMPPNHIPISNTRYERKLSATLSSDDEDAAHLLVMMHHSPTIS
ncbi:hypothetical protein G6F46_012118 [Rhizopus delemar]|uniref:Uncharacterized protein n=3 Tax=Rhizopus TaxID=4842 RepID=I1CA27_RHIO9|nr:hypothetical protein RO3G_10017 [Rhizopus delemar RA 99-880]KAG1047510.1 hypothetical protein G6F43_010046 [Rhizopus delemar]KAG1533963.1 hypothetical protein G6F51_012351 [Rhizopus arrhizus]KAG1443216.1 hypothetical protein G6F55_012736 [Rhizopus delemar]KAG1488736.1 hypothetical protein G6F54_011912 [Rhizopus delemar]|eukprot:EIE85307.1 hypothetical protein RO3G_10017 [Rhizopus delemar RA 99-880]